MKTTKKERRIKGEAEEEGEGDDDAGFREEKKERQKAEYKTRGR